MNSDKQRARQKNKNIQQNVLSEHYSAVRMKEHERKSKADVPLASRQIIKTPNKLTA
jgi:hypothetical protein